MPLPLEAVVKQLEDSGVISDGKLENFVPPKANPTSAEELIAELVRQNHLTKFQAAQVAAGRAKSLILGGYTILDKIGAGGMGQVFKARHRRMDRLVAIKMLPPGTMKDAAAVARFEREVRAAAKLRHPNIVAADDADEFHGVHFLVMEFVDGHDLSATVKKNGPLPVDTAVSFILQAARGLEFAHSEGVVHRDIKPSNLLVDKKGTVKILDMGLARIEAHGDVATQAELTGTGAVMGTVDYMAPEQAISTKGVDGRADIYSLGCTLFYLLTGRAAYFGETITAKLIAHQSEPIPDLQAACNEATPELAAVFQKMMAKKAVERYQSMTEVIVDLEQVQGDARQATGESRIGRVGGWTGMGSGTSLGPKTSAAPAKTSYLENAALPIKGAAIATAMVTAPTKRPQSLSVGIASGGSGDDATLLNPGPAPRRTKKFVAVLAGVVLAGVSIIALIAFSSRRSEKHFVAAPPSAAIVPRQPDHALSFTMSGVYVATPVKYDGSHPITIEAYVTSERKFTSRQVIMGNVQGTGGLHLFGEADRWLFAGAEAPEPSRALLTAKQLKTHVAGVWDGSAVTLFVNGLAQPSQSAKGIGDSKLPFVIGGDPGKAISVLPPYIESAANRFNGQLDEVRISKVARYTSNFTPQPQFEPDADTLALYHFDEGTGTIAHDASGNNHHAKIVGAKWVPADGGSINPLAKTSSPPTVATSPLDALRREDIPPDELKAAGFGDPAKAPPELVAVYGDSRMTHWNLISRIAYTPDGRSIISASSDGMIIAWDVETGRPIREINAGANITAMALRPDGKMLAYYATSDGIHLWDVEAWRAVNFLDAEGGVDALAFSPDGRTLASVGHSVTTITLWSLETRQPTASLTGHSKSILDVVFSPDGKTLASCGGDECRLWDVATGKQRHALEGDGSTITFSRDGRLVAASTLGKSTTPTTVWNAETGAVIKTTAALASQSLVFSVDGKTLYGSLGGVPAYVDVETGEGQLLADLGPAFRPPLALSPDGRTLAAGIDNMLLFFNTATTQPIGAGPGRKSVNDIALTSDGRQLAVAHCESQLELWDLVVGSRKSFTDAGRVMSVSFSPDGNWLYSGSGGQTSRVARRRELATDVDVPLPNAVGIVYALAASSDGQTVAIATNAGATVWNLEAGTRRQFTAVIQRTVAFVPDGRTLITLGTASPGRTGITAWDVSSGEVRSTWAVEASTVAVSPDGTRVATARGISGSDGVRMWDLATGQETPGFKPIRTSGTMQTRSVAFSPDGRLLAVVCGNMHEVRLCDAYTGAVVRFIPLFREGLPGGAHCAAFDATGRYLLTGNGNGTVYVLRLGATAASPPPPAKSAPSVAVAPFDAAQARAHQESWAAHLGTQVETTNSVGGRMVLIPPGEFLMGSTDEQVAAVRQLLEGQSNNSAPLSHLPSEQPPHRVVLTNPFWIGAAEVSIDEYRQFADAAGYRTVAEQAGEENTFRNKIATATQSAAAYISWDDAVAYCNWLTRKEAAGGGGRYRLPTEAEWEYACRAGTTTLFNFGDDESQLKSNVRKVAAAPPAADETPPNAFGLCDMHGSLYEWCQDSGNPRWYESSPAVDPVFPGEGMLRIVRGGSHNAKAQQCRSAARYHWGLETHFWNNGFRVVREIDLGPESNATGLSNVDPDRRAAEWVLSVGGFIHVRIGGVDRRVSSLSDLPTGPWSLTQVNLSTATAKVAELPAADFANLAGLEQLEFIDLYGQRQFREQGFRALATWRRLKTLNLRNTHFSTVDFPALELPELISLDIGNNALTDESLVKFQQLRSLQLLHCTQNPALTEAALLQLNAALPQCEIRYRNTDQPLIVEPGATPAPTPSATK